MDIKQAIEILETHNRWRRGDDTVPMLKPKDIGIAIDIVVEHANQRGELLVDFWMNLPHTNKNKNVAKHYVDKYLESEL
tara:strand:+ start:209 stop:445 length:237 start_codon:yes stop_codon:yes gene_type:complete